MSNALFSQIPVQILGKLDNKLRTRSEKPKKKVKFYEEDEEIEPDAVLGSSAGSTEIDVIDLDDCSNEPTSSNQKDTSSKRKDDKETDHAAKKTSATGKTRDAMLQTEEKVLVDQGSQTNESLLNRPLSMTEADVHRLNMQSFAPIMPLPRSRGSNGPPLKIGLTLRGKKRKVLYPDDDDYVPPEICSSARGA